MSVERRTAKPVHSHPELVTEIVNALDENRRDDSGPDVPRIIEIEQTYGNSLRVYVIWDKWEDIPHSERGPIILDAYRQKKGDLEMLRITGPIGLTEIEAKRHNIQ